MNNKFDIQNTDWLYATQNKDGNFGFTAKTLNLKLNQNINKSKR